MKQILFFSILLMNTFLVSAQMKQGNKPQNNEQREARREKMESLKIAHIASKLNLDPKTAEAFWPVYNQYENEMRGLVQEARAKRLDNDMDVDDMLEKEQKALDIKKKYTAQFNKVLRPEQVSSLFQAEKEFRMMMMRKAREIKTGEGRPQQGPGMRR
ncbi:MAG: hypothetical protein ACR2IL_09130 [Chitinophagaceae bacterium]